MSRVAWHHLLFEIPPEWEALGYINNPDNGQLVLGDRLGETFQVFWKKTGDGTDLERRLAALVLAQADMDVPEEQVRERIAGRGAWLVYVPASTAQATFAGRFLADTGILLLTVFPPHPLTTQARVTDVLASYESNDADERVWALLGLDVTIPASMRLDAVEAVPAMQRFVFENERNESITVERYGMASRLLGRDDLATFMARRKGRAIQLLREGRFRKGARGDGMALSYRTKGSGREYLGALLARRWDGRVWVWQRSDIERIFAIDYHARHPHQIENLYERVRDR